MQLILEQNPIAKARHRHMMRGSKVITFDPQSGDKEAARWALHSQMRSKGFDCLQEGPLYMSLINYTPIPESWSNKRRIASEGQPCTSRPDIDNYVKFYSDVLNEVAYHDDKQITQLWSEKVYSSTPRVEILIQPIGGSMIKEHAITIIGELTPDQLNYIIKKANKLGLQQRQIVRVFAEEDNEGKHLYFEAEGLRKCSAEV